MWALSSKSKAALWTYNIQRYLRHHPELSVEAQEAMHEGVRLISTPGWFDIQKGSFGYEAKSLALETHKRRVESVLQREAIQEVFMRLGPEPLTFETEMPMLQSIDTRATALSSDVAPLAEYDGCHCASAFDCIYWLVCSSSYCDPVRHCGWYGDELCWGRCKIG
jgi:hypothetical protein